MEDSDFGIFGMRKINFGWLNKCGFSTIFFGFSNFRHVWMVRSMISPMLTYEGTVRSIISPMLTHIWAIRSIIYLMLTYIWTVQSIFSTELMSRGSGVRGGRWVKATAAAAATATCQHLARPLDHHAQVPNIPFGVNASLRSFPSSQPKTYVHQPNFFFVQAPVWRVPLQIKDICYRSCNEKW